MCVFLATKSANHSWWVTSSWSCVSKDFLKKRSAQSQMVRDCFCTTTAGPSHFNTGHWRVCARSALLSFGWIFQFTLHQQYTLRMPWLTLKIPKAPCLALFITLSFHTQDKIAACRQKQSFCAHRKLIYQATKAWLQCDHPKQILSCVCSCLCHCGFWFCLFPIFLIKSQAGQWR